MKGTFQYLLIFLEHYFVSLAVCISLQNRQPMMNQMTGVSNMNLPLRPNVPNQVRTITMATQKPDEPTDI